MAEEVVPELYKLLVKEEATVERTREVRMGGVSGWYIWAQPRCKSMELMEGEAMMESWLMTSRHRWRADGTERHRWFRRPRRSRSDKCSRWRQSA